MHDRPIHAVLPGECRDRDAICFEPLPRLFRAAGRELLHLTLPGHVAVPSTFGNFVDLTQHCQVRKCL